MSYKKRIELYPDGIGAVEYVQHMGTDLTIVNSARVSFGKQKSELDDKDKKLIGYLIRNKHTSTLEHCQVTFRFKVPLFVRSQHHRHRTWSYNEISRRYTDINMCFYEPKVFRTQHKSNRQASNVDEIDPGIMCEFPDMIGDVLRKASKLMRDHHRESLNLYDKFIEAGVCREQARGLLPQNMYTEYYGSCNLNNLMKFIELRVHEHAQWEIRKVAEACLEIASDLFPVTIESYKKIRDQRD